MGFKATEAVEELTYDFNPYVKESGTIPEPTVSQVDAFRRRLFEAFRGTGLDIESVRAGKIDLSQVDTLLETVDGLEAEMTSAVADLTGIAHSTLNALPARVKQAFMGWITGEFASPEASAPATR